MMFSDGICAQYKVELVLTITQSVCFAPGYAQMRLRWVLSLGLVPHTYAIQSIMTAGRCYQMAVS